MNLRETDFILLELADIFFFQFNFPHISETSPIQARYLQISLHNSRNTLHMTMFKLSK